MKGEMFAKVAQTIDDRLWKYRWPTRISLEQNDLESAWKWLEEQVRESKVSRVNADAMALAGVALGRWDRQWYTTDTAEKLSRDLWRVLPAAEEPIARDLALAAAWLLEIADHRNEDPTERARLRRKIGAGLDDLRAHYQSNGDKLAACVVSIHWSCVKDDVSPSVDLGMPATDGADPYILANELWATSIVAGTVTVRDMEIADGLKRHLNIRPVNRATFVSTCAILRALAAFPDPRATDSSRSRGSAGCESGHDDSPDRGLEPTTAAQLAELVELERHQSGSWHGNVWDSSWAMLTLAECKGFQYLRVPIGDGASIARDVREQIVEAVDELVCKSRVVRTRVVPEIMAWVVLLTLLLVFLAWLVLTTDPGLYLGVMGAGLAGVIIFVGRRVFSLWRSTQAIS